MKNHQIQEGCAQDGFEIDRKKYVGILSRRREDGQRLQKGGNGLAGLLRDKVVTGCDS
jgi:hypothetical protein